MEKYQHQVATHKLNDFGMIDYKQPLDKKPDMRTSTYLGNKHMTDLMLGDKIHAKFKDCRQYKEDIILDRERTTDYRANFNWKFPDPDNVRNPTVAGIKHIKPFYEGKLKFLKRPMKPATSTSHSDYIWNPDPPQDPPESLPMPAPVAAIKVNMDRAKPGYTKLLDPQATTSRLDYCPRSPQDIASSVGAHDSITYWNWSAMDLRNIKVFRERDSKQCDTACANECVSRRGEYQNMTKPVPNSGLTTEVRENYLEPYKRAISYKNSHIRNLLTHLDVDPSPKLKEYDIYGSGENPRKYV